jgi:hypothetical protein
MAELEIEDWVRLELLRVATHCLEKDRPDLFRRLMTIQKTFVQEPVSRSGSVAFLTPVHST